MRYRILGPVEISLDDRPIVIGAGKERALLVRLLIDAGRTVSVDRLVDDLWVGDPPSAANVSLRVLVSRLRKTLAEAGVPSPIETRHPGYVLKVGEDDEVDAETFERLTSEGRRAMTNGDSRVAAETLARALELWRGPALADVADAAYAQAEAGLLEEARLACLEERIEADLACGAHASLIGELEALCAMHPTRERLWAARMLALYRSGRQADALAVYQELRAMFSDELGIDPSPQLQRLELQILNHEPEIGPVPRPVDAGVLTFLMTDIEGSTPLWESHPVEMPAVLERHDAIVATVVERNGGRRVKSRSEGDATLSVFARASDAAIAAIELQDELSRETWPSAIELKVRTSVHSGEAHQRDGDYHGRTLNRGARIRELAAGGQILVSQATAELVRDDVPGGYVLEDFGRHVLRGLTREEHVYDLCSGEDDTDDASIELGLPSVFSTLPITPFVGRDLELDHLRMLWKRASSGTLTAVSVAGEPGIGKTRLACEIARELASEGALVLYGRCDEDLGIPYQPFVDALDALVGACTPRQLRRLTGRSAPDLARLVPAVGEVLPSLPAAAANDPEIERLRLFESVETLLENVSTQRPVVLLLDDLHWATKATLLMLRHLLRGAQTMRVLIVATYRDTELDRAHPLAQMLADLRGHGNAERVVLSGLSTDGIADYLIATGGHELDDRARDFAAALHAETEGNPFFVSEVLRHLTETGALYQEAGRWTSAAISPDELGLPEGVREVITRRLDRLSESVNKAIAVAAVMGTVVELRALERVPDAADDPDSLLDAMDSAVRHGVLAEAGPGRYVFTHALIRQTLIAELTLARRTRLHRRIGEALESLPDAGKRVEALAHHFVGGATDGQVEKAGRYSLAAARQALLQLSFESATAHSEAGLSVVDLDPEPHLGLRCDLRVALARATAGGGDLTTAREVALKAAADARALASSERLTELIVVFSGLNAATDPDDELGALCREALAVLGDNEPALRAQSMAGLARYLAWSEGRAPEALPLISEAVTLARASGSAQALGTTLSSCCYAISATERVIDARPMADELLALSFDINDVTLRSDALMCQAMAHMQEASADGFEDSIQSLERLAVKSPSWRIRSAISMFRGIRAMLDGRFADGLTIGENFLREFSNDRTVIGVWGAQRTGILRELGRYAEAIPELEAYAEVFPGLVGVPSLIGLYRAELGSLDEARLLIEPYFENDFTRFKRDQTWAIALGILSEAAGIYNEPEWAAQLEPALAPMEGLLTVVGRGLCIGSADRLLGIVRTVLGQTERAIEHFETALMVERRMRAPTLISRTGYWYGRTLLMCGEEEKGRAILTDSIATAEQLGQVLLADQISELLSSSPERKR